MTIRVSRVDGVEIPAAQDRRALYSGWTAGPLAAGDGLVEAQGTPNMTVRVATISGLLIDDGVSFGDGKLVLESDAITTVTIATSDATNPRIDLVVAKVTGVEFGGADAFTIEAVTGTPAASPSAPATPTRAYVLAQVRVDAGVTSIQANKITDTRVRSGLLPRTGARLHKAVSAVATGTMTSITWGTEDEDTHGYIAVPGTTVTIPSGQGGLHAVTFHTRGSFSGAHSLIQIVPTSTLAHIPADWRVPMESQDDRGLVTVVTPFAAGDSFLCQLYHETGSSVNFESFLSCYKIGP